MRGRTLSTSKDLPERDLHELSDILAVKLYERLGHRSYSLARRDIADLIDPYVKDASNNDRKALIWLVWELLQEGAEIEFAVA